MTFLERTKEDLRKFGIQQLQRIAESGEKEAKERKLYQKLYESSKWQRARTIGLTIANGFEISTQPLIESAQSAGKSIAVPKTLPKRQMAFYQVDQETAFEKSSFGVFEPISDRYYSPDEIDLLIVPGIIFHECGYRIGFGGGYYDRYLQNYPNATCSLVFHELINNEWLPESFDKKIQQLFTDV